MKKQPIEFETAKAEAIFDKACELIALVHDNASCQCPECILGNAIHTVTRAFAEHKPDAKTENVLDALQFGVLISIINLDVPNRVKAMFIANVSEGLALNGLAVLNGDEGGAV